MHIREYFRARKHIINWWHFCKMRRKSADPDKWSKTAIHLKNGLTIIGRIGTCDLLAIRGIFLKSYNREMKDYYDVVVDGGAHIGCFSLFIQNKCRHVYAIEPAPDNYEMLLLNLQENNIKNVTPLHAALSGTDGEITLFYHKYKSDSHSTVDYVKSTQQDEMKEEISVPGTTVRSLMQKHNILKIDLLKMDCEGAEHEVLLGLDANDAVRINEIFMEYHDLENPRRDFSSFDSHLQLLGYSLKLHKKRKGRGYAHYIRAAG